MYDFPVMFREACKMRWHQHARLHALPKSIIPKEFVRFTELVLDKHDNLIEIHRVPGQNDTGMIAWKMTLFVPEYPEGRDIIVIANDITFQIGTFGPREDKLYMKASELSRAHKIPRIYLSGMSRGGYFISQSVLQMLFIAATDNTSYTELIAVTR